MIRIHWPVPGDGSSGREMREMDEIREMDEMDGGDWRRRILRFSFQKIRR